MIKEIERTNDIGYLKRENKKKDFANQVLYFKLKQSESKLKELEKKFYSSEIKKREDEFIHKLELMRNENIELHNVIVGLKAENKYYQGKIKIK